MVRDSFGLYNECTLWAEAHTFESGTGKRRGFLIGRGVLLVFLIVLFVASCTSPGPSISSEERSGSEDIEAPEIDESMKQQAREADEKTAGVEDGEAEEQEESSENLGEGRESKEQALLSEEKEAAKPLSKEDERRLQRIVENLAYLVYPRYGDEVGTSQFGQEGRVEQTSLLDSAAEVAHTVLSEHGKEYVEYGQVRKMLQERKSVYTSQTDGAIPVLRWSAYKFNADIYAEMGLRTKVQKEADTYYATAAVSLTFFSTKSGEKWASVRIQSEKAYASKNSGEEAQRLALGKIVRRAMARGLDKAEKRAFYSIRKGLSYHLEFRNLKNREGMNNFIKSLKGSVESIDRTTYTSKRSVYTVRFIGSVTELEEEVFRTAENVSGFEDLFLVYQRGYTLIFNTGM